jgi:hypothetical protein
MKKSARDNWTLANELTLELRTVQSGKMLTEEHDFVRDKLIRDEIMALKREVCALQQAAGIPYLQIVK